MNSLLHKWMQNQGMRISLYFILLLIVFNSAFVFLFRSKMEEYKALSEDVLQITKGVERLNADVNLADMGLRGFMLHPVESMYFPARNALQTYHENLAQMRKTLERLGFDMSIAATAELALRQYMLLVEQMHKLVESGKLDEALEILYADPGYEAWQVYHVYDREASRFATELKHKAELTYRNYLRWALILQLGILVIALPTLIIADMRISKNRRHRNQIYREIEDSNRKYVFNPSQENKEKTENEIVEDLIHNLKEAAGFIQKISSGNYQAQWNGYDQSNANFNQSNLAGELIKMRDNMKSQKLQDDRRIWMNQGLSEFGELIRKYQDDSQKLAEFVISKLVNHLGAKQGGFFMVNNEDEKNVYLQMMACYAYERKKHMHKRIEIGEGMIGQCFLEAETIHLTKLPENYVYISSGLGDSRPKSILIIPLKANGEVQGIIEMASLKVFQDIEIEFAEKLGESLASSIVSVRNNQKTKNLLSISQEQAELMRAQEEEMRQNMEELQATQEEMARKTAESIFIEQSVDKSMLRVTLQTDTKIKNANTRFRESFNISPGQYDIMKITDFLMETDIPAFEELWNDILQGNAVNSDFNFIDNQNQQKSLFLSLNPQIDRNGKIKQVLLIGQDISQFKLVNA
ncbi:MAG: GAF domain-containing protein [Cyclobacteriaceae bacterium]|nr:GAF domain-containing protein [Cyclobacteriaceae bacterium]